jgi:hypothetical protein
MGAWLSPNQKTMQVIYSTFIIFAAAKEKNMISFEMVRL